MYDLHPWTEGNGALNPEVLGNGVKQGIRDLTEPTGKISGLDFEKLATQAIKISPELCMNNCIAAQCNL